MTSSAPPTSKSSYVEGRLAKLEARLAETQAELIELKGIKQQGNNVFSTPAAAGGSLHGGGDEEDVVAMAVHLGLGVSDVKAMSAQQRWLVRSITQQRVPVSASERFIF